VSRVFEIVTDADIEKVWDNADFGSMSKRDVIRFGLLKAASGYHQGHTSMQIITELGLVTYANHNITKKGREYLWEAFSNGTKL
jgi:hypothetical protein